ncbi:protein-L-isoaspartate O-methyltransferase family protein [Cognatilysobacter bugurensis]|uniref:Protein-L-isoaspartate O-methyltransferase n=1 Tax=Cognatilysobacter bugurensis TaxID=543356 RepID=A0A918SZI9_9GAMM|nr:protein-L-isoaspartate O-methyltransferase [Lysobacter bugurensis]GHA81037.1 protein-L-isoaspartate O-methyltransferase [Lysobacter bugurensis]
MNTLDYAQARELMVEQQVRPWDVNSPRVLEVIGSLPREHFLPDAHRLLAYADLAVPLAHGQFMLKPVLEGRALQALDPAEHEDVLEIGTGSGYLTACFASLAREVVSLERHADLASGARGALASLGIHNARIETADAFEWSTDRRFDAICVSGAVAEIPERFVNWLKPGGRMFIVRGRSPAMEAVRVTAGNASRPQSLFETDIPYLAGAAPVPAFQL